MRNFYQMLLEKQYNDNDSTDMEKMSQKRLQSVKKQAQRDVHRAASTVARKLATRRASLVRRIEKSVDGVKKDEK
jgi:hypothetical protein|tara:strand:- start:415 stop:639 length:225 start_codon:yes stop_codon:yes gene_type:complete